MEAGTYTGEDRLQRWEYSRARVIVFILHKSKHDWEDLL